MARVRDVFGSLDGWADFATQLGFDNSGFLLGRGAQEVSGILVALDVTGPVAEEALELGANLIVSHHPVIFDPLRSLTDETPAGELLLRLAERRVAVISAHTNLDAAQGGVNDCLARALELEEIAMLSQDGVDRTGKPYGIGRVGLARTPGLSAGAYAAFVKEKLNAAGLRYVDAGRPVEKVAVGGGSCGSMLKDAAAAGCDSFVTADVKYNVFLDARAMGINLMDAGHFATENVVCPAISAFLQTKFPGLPVRLSQIHREVYSQV